ncbi:MAG: elongation factor P [Patescibacteria group bacterium]|nr:elongation factor P [Patescibacteria group bacterium]
MDINELKKQGTVIKLENEPYLVLRSQHARTAQRRAFVRTTLKNLISGKTIEKTFNAGDKIEEAEIRKIKAAFLYRQGKNFSFMNLENFEEISLSEEQIEKKKDFLKEGLEVLILYFEDRPVALELPQKVSLKVIEASPAVRGDTAQGKTLKTVKLETGLEIETPLFVETGDEVIVNTETGQYVERK